MATDPICGMTVNPENAAGKHEHNGQSYYFCSQNCLAKFKEDPEKITARAARRTYARHCLTRCTRPGRDTRSAYSKN